jgi:hypothetical protein
MNLQRRDFLLVVTLAGAAAMPAWGQTVARPAGGDAQISASIPDFSGLWGHPYWPGFEQKPTSVLGANGLASCDTRQSTNRIPIRSISPSSGRAAPTPARLGSPDGWGDGARGPRNGQLDVRVSCES